MDNCVAQAGVGNACIKKTLGGFELGVYSIYYVTKNMAALNITHHVKTTTSETSSEIAVYA